jgi:hypothetical protein
VNTAIITRTCRRKFQASDVTKPVPLGELFKHRPLFGGQFKVSGCCPDSDGSGSNAACRIVGVSCKRTKQERCAYDLPNRLSASVEFLSHRCEKRLHRKGKSPAQSSASGLEVCGKSVYVKNLARVVIQAIHDHIEISEEKINAK